MYQSPRPPSDINEIEKAIIALPEDKLAQFREWFTQFDAQNWDKEFEEDAKSGKLDQLAAAAIADHLKGNSSEI